MHENTIKISYSYKMYAIFFCSTHQSFGNHAVYNCMIFIIPPLVSEQELRLGMGTRVFHKQWDSYSISADEF